MEKEEGKDGEIILVSTYVDVVIQRFTVNNTADQ